MKHVMIFEQYMNESKNSTFSHSVLSTLEPTIIEMVEQIKKWIIENNDKKGIKHTINQWEEEMIRLGLIKDMLKSFEKYTQPTDLLKTIQPRKGSKGIELFATIIRDGEEYTYYTEAIGAGGYNIQSFHFRYLTKTNLPKPKIMGTLAKEYENKIKHLSKLEKLNKTIEEYESKIKSAEELLELNKNKDDNQIWDEIKSMDTYYEWPSWEEIIKRGVDSHYKTEEYYNFKKEEALNGYYNRWKMTNIADIEKRIFYYRLEISKLNKKLEKLV